jgi:hypothetical protein
MRNYNLSAFNGYRKTDSNYSQVLCTRKGCWGNWRTKASYVSSLPDEKSVVNNFSGDENEPLQ